MGFLKILRGGKRAKSKSEYWLTDDGLILLEGWARDGLTDEQIANNIGIVPSTFYDWKKKYPKFSDTLKKGKEVVDFEVENALLKSAKEGNVTAQIFWLKNRKPDIWRERQDKNNSNNDKVEELLQKLEKEASL